VSEPIFINNEVFLHHINKFDVKHLMNFLPGGGGFATPASLNVDLLMNIGASNDRIQSVKNQKKIYSLSKNDLLYKLDNYESFSISPRLDHLICASKFRNNKKIGKFDLSSSKPKHHMDGWIDMGYDTIWSNQIPGREEDILKISEHEIEFELTRRQCAPSAPSRITCLFMVEDTIEGRIYLSKIYDKPDKRRHNPLLLKLGIVHKDRLLKADSNWFTLYNTEQREEYISNYWHGKASDNPEWEILFEGMVGLRNNNQKSLLKTSLDVLLGRGNATT